MTFTAQREILLDKTFSLKKVSGKFQLKSYGVPIVIKETKALQLATTVVQLFTRKPQIGAGLPIPLVVLTGTSSVELVGRCVELVDTLC